MESFSGHILLSDDHKPVLAFQSQILEEETYLLTNVTIVPKLRAISKRNNLNITYSLLG